MMTSRTTSLACVLLTVALIGCGTSDIKKPATGGTGGDSTGGSIGTGGTGTGGIGTGGTGTGGTTTGGAIGTGGMITTGGTGGTQLPDGGPDGSPDTAPPPDTGPTCVSGAACALASGGKGICRNNACSACLEPAEDSLCNAAYGPGNICLAGVCAPGTCHTSQQCGDQKICRHCLAHLRGLLRRQLL